MNSVAPPLTHHEILTLVEPFARRGRHVDLAASNRLERRLAFRSIAVEAALHETLELESLGTGTYRLTRVLTRSGGERATLEAMGPDPAQLVGKIEALAPQDQFGCGPGFMIARSYALDPVTGELTLTRGVAWVAALRLTLTLSSVRGVAADLALESSAATRAEPGLPDDLLAVLGWDWARLVRSPSGWKTKLRLRGNPARRTRLAERALDQAAAHLARTLAEPPARFHQRWLAARWGVFFRRGIPVWTFLALLIALAVLRRTVTHPNPGALMLLFHVPTVLIAASFCLQELPQYEIPPLPRRSRAPDWRRDVAPDVSPGDA